MKDSVVVTLRLSRKDYEALLVEAKAQRVGVGVYLRQLALAGRDGPHVVDAVLAALEGSLALRLRFRALIMNVAEG